MNHYRNDFLRRFDEALERARRGDRRPMEPPRVRVQLVEEWEREKAA